MTKSLEVPVAQPGVLEPWTNFPSQVDQNGVVYGPFSDRKCCKNGVFTAVYSVNTVRFRLVSIRIHGRRLVRYETIRNLCNSYLQYTVNKQEMNYRLTN